MMMMLMTRMKNILFHPHSLSACHRERKGKVKKKGKKSHQLLNNTLMLENLPINRPTVVF